MKGRKKIGVIIVVASLLLAVILMDIWMVFQQTREQTRTSGIYQLQNISGDLERQIGDAENLTMQIAIQAREYMDDPIELERFIYGKKQEIIEGQAGAFNVYVAGDGWSIIPDFDKPENFVATERVWYTGAVRCDGKPYVTSPYQDAMTDKVCYTVSVMLGDGDTVLGVDYTIDTIQTHIRQMYGESARKAVIVTDEGIIAGCSDETLIGKNLVEAIPEYAGIWSLSKNSKDVATARIKSDLLYENLFAAEAGNGWYLIVSESDWELYRNSYVQLFVTLFLSIALFMVVIALYIMAVNSQKKAEDVLRAKEEFLNGITGRLREPLMRIQTLSAGGEIENVNDAKVDMAGIHEAADRLAEMISQLISYSSIARTEKKKNKGKNVKTDIGRENRRYRFVILSLMVVVMIIGLYTNVRVSYLWGTSRMKSYAERYEYELSEWINTQKSILDMFVSTISTNPEMLEDYEGTVAYLNRITLQYPQISVTYMTNPELPHTVFMNNGWEPDSDWRVEERQWYKDTLASEKGWSISAPYYDEQTGGYCVTISECVYDSVNGEFLGIFGIDFFMDKLVGILGDSYSSTGYAFIVDTEGRIINHPYGSYQMTKDGSTNVLELPYGDVKPDGEDTLIFKDYDGSYKVLLAMKNKVSGFTVYVVSGTWTVYGSVVVYGFFSMVLLLVCIILVYRLLTGMIKWQEEVSAQLKEAADEAVAAGNAKGRFLAQMSHEIRTPINAVLDMNEMILREAKDESVLNYAESVQMAGSTLLSLINDILDFSKIEDGKMEIIPVNYHPAMLIANLVNSISERAKKKGLELIVNADASIPSELYGDEVRIRQVITNILTNAVKYTEKGSITFSVGIVGINQTTEDAAEEKQVEGARAAVGRGTIQLKVSVKDTGIGIKPEDMQKLFQEFERIEEERNRNIEGTGLGMSITQSLLEMMGTSLKVDSVYGEGSDFYFFLEQKVINEEPMGDYDSAFHKILKKQDKYHEKFTAPTARLLVVDDNKMNLIVFKNLLKKTQIKIDTADDGDGGLALTRENKYDIIFFDHMMPGKDGIETLKELKADEGNVNLDTPTICLTANAISGAREEYIEAGFDDYLTKPIEPKELESLVASYLPKEKIEES